jgi:hypothetical protein
LRIKTRPADTAEFSHVVSYTKLAGKKPSAGRSSTDLLKKIPTIDLQVGKNAF